ncbi:hypothetical protein DICVIV_08686 [Dictyocaulus viviparus]|uniref:Uncharacterized protein n=1 Tax=Dictyocaulus viviparus TaxID=29172 RepID=A0A0D8XL64_DICVI|nr:hypothetical protein DICVIV_08686 [Dictyocaulus viviparus]
MVRMICRRAVLRYSTAFQCLWFSTPSPSNTVNHTLNKTICDGIAHATSVNVLTAAKSTVQLKASKRQIRKFRKLFTVPQQAISGLRDALISCDRPPKQIQHEADQLSEILMHRRFPAPNSLVQKARNQAKSMLMENEEQYGMYDLISDDLKQSGINYKLRHDVDKILKKAHFNWRPLTIETKEAAAAYALSRLAPNYAEISRVLEEFNGIEFCPESVLDYGCGIGSERPMCGAENLVVNRWCELEFSNSLQSCAIKSLSLMDRYIALMMCLPIKFKKTPLERSLDDTTNKGIQLLGAFSYVSIYLSTCNLHLAFQNSETRI